jgi:valyl-tRNA synthetase
MEHYMVYRLREKDGIANLNFVAEMNGKIVGHIIYSNAHILQPDGSKVDVLNFGPISVLPEMQKSGIGGALIKHSIEKAKKLGHGAILFFGSPEYYSRFGFVPANEFDITDCNGENYPAFMAMELKENFLKDVTGKFIEADIYNDDLNREAAKAFDRQFITSKKEVPMNEIPKHYDPSREAEIYAGWLQRGYFDSKAPQPDAAAAKQPYTIMMPPPNITDKLHIGHAFNATVQDILIRFKRMQGFEVLWQPGTDHAAISTEVQVVKAIAKEGLTKEGMGREKFLKRVWQWQAEYGSVIVEQFKKIGSSCDWSRERFTMDEGLSAAVLEAFERLYNEGMIYRGERLVNWCVKCATTISDAEVEHEDGDGFLYHFSYPLAQPVAGISHISFATTRPETMLGDTAIAIHPEDERYKQLVGQQVFMPLAGTDEHNGLRGRFIPIIADAYVDKEYGTGVVKITPAHDPNDFEIGERHSLPRINIMNDDGTINQNGGAYAGLTREAAREKIITNMTALGLFVKTEKITHAKGTHDRCHTIVEPLIKLQWFLRMDELAKPALEAYTSGKLKFNRERFGKIYAHWLDIIKDWCISRQIWWGHRIPAYYCPAGHISVAKTAPAACTTCGAADLRQDEDTLDTWFSSALWPFSTLGWPQKTPDLEYFYKTNVLSTAQEIIFFWVVRMVFMGIKFMGEIPFEHVLIHGTVRDANGVKMSKSLGNGIDPIEIVDKFGADVLRLNFVNGNAIDSDTRFKPEKVEFCRNFMNKLWNASRFVLMNADGDGSAAAAASNADFIEDRWILSRLNELVRDTTVKFDTHEIGMATGKIVDFVWDEFCDWYVEMVKPRLRVPEQKPQAMAVLVQVLGTCLKLLHPVVPFITEDLYRALSLASQHESIMFAPWPQHEPALNDPAAEQGIETLKEAVRGVRNIRAERTVPPSQKITLHIVGDKNQLFTRTKEIIKILCGAEQVNVATSAENTAVLAEGAISLVVPGATIYLPLASLVDADKERARLLKEQKRLQGELARIDSKLANQGFLAKAPPQLIDAEHAKRTQFDQMLTNIEAELAAL